MKTIKRSTLILCCAVLMISSFVVSGFFIVRNKKTYAATEEVLSMSGLVSEEVGVNGIELDKTLVKAQLVHGKWGKYQAFDGLYNVDPDNEDQVYATDSVAQRGDVYDISTYIKRYQISATTNNDAVFKFTFKEDARMYLVHGTFGGDFNNNWATHATWILAQETDEGAAAIATMPTQSVTSDNLYYCDVHGKAGDVIYMIYRMAGDTTVPGHNYANMFLDCSFIFKTADYSLSQRNSIFAASDRIYKEEAYTMSSLVSEEVSGGISSKMLADVSLVHGRWGAYQAFDGKYNVTPDDEDQVYATDSNAQHGDSQDISTYIKRYQLSATKRNDAVFKFEFTSNATLYVNHGTFAGFESNWATHGYFMIIQEPDSGAYVVEQTSALATTVNNMFSGEVNAKAGDTVYVIYKMNSETTVPGHEYANIFLDFTFTLREGDYVEADRSSVLVSSNLYEILSLVNGAYIRLEQPYGLRFVVSANLFDVEDLTVGLRLTSPSRTGHLDIVGNKYVDEGNTRTYYFALVGFSEEDLTTSFTATAYYEKNSVRSYGSVSVTRSIAQVANSARSIEATSVFTKAFTDSRLETYYYQTGLSDEQCQLISDIASAIGE